MKGWDDIKLEGNLNILIWAPSGNGKTALAGTFPGLLYVDCDAVGLKVWRGPWYKGWHGKPDLIGWDSFEDEVDNNGLFVSANAFWRALEFINENADKEGVETIVIDSLSGLQDLAMHVAFELSAQANRSKSLATVKDVAKNTVRAGVHPVILPTQADFGSEMSVFQQFMDQLVTMPKTIICCAHERLEYTSTGAIRKRGPLLTGSAIRARVAKWFDEVWYLDVRDGKRMLITQPDGLIEVVKTRVGVPNNMEDPTYKKLAAVWK